MAQWGAQDVLAPYSTKFHFLPRKTLKVIAGPPLDLSPWAGRTRDRAAEQEVTDLMMAEITKLLEELRGETAPAVRYVQPPEELAPAAEPAKPEAANVAAPAEPESAAAPAAPEAPAESAEPEPANAAAPAEPAKPEPESEATPADPAAQDSAQDSKAASGAEVGE
jgi:hypothetical protein